VIYGSLAVLLIAQNFVEQLNHWVISFISSLSSFFYAQQMDNIASFLGRITAWLSGTGESLLGTVLNIIFWPFQAIGEATISGYFTPTQALAPAMVVLYSTILFLIAADLIASKDLELLE
jgi:hypothetical protein